MAGDAIDIGHVDRRGPGQADVGHLGLAWPVHDATHHGNVDRRGDVLEPGLQGVYRGNDIEVLARTTGAGNQVHALLAQAQALEDVEADLDLFDRVGRQGNADRVADTVHQQQAETDRRLHGAGAQAAGLRNAQVQRLFDLRGELAVGRHGHEHFGRLEAYLEVLEIVGVQDVDVAHGGFDHGVGIGFAVLAQQFLAERSRVDADTQRHATVACGFDDGAHAVLAADVAGIDTQAVHAVFEHLQRDVMIKMDVGHQRDGGAGPDFAEGFRGFHGRHGHTHEIRADLFKTFYLRQGGSHVAGIGIRHALYGDGRIAAYRHVAHHDPARPAALYR